jgi:hypothetical protein
VTTAIEIQEKPISVLGLAAPFAAAVQTTADAGLSHWHPLYPLILAGYSWAFAVAAAIWFRWNQGPDDRGQ